MNHYFGKTELIEYSSTLVLSPNLVKVAESFFFQLQKKTEKENMLKPIKEFSDTGGPATRRNAALRFLEAGRPAGHHRSRKPRQRTDMMENYRSACHVDSYPLPLPHLSIDRRAENETKRKKIEGNKRPTKQKPKRTKKKRTDKADRPNPMWQLWECYDSMRTERHITRLIFFISLLSGLSDFCPPKCRL